MVAGAEKKPPGSDLEAPARHYRKLCSRCHGADFAGRDRAGAPDFTSGDWHKGRSDAQLFISIRDGKGWRMPGFSGKLSDKESRALVRLIRNANRTRPAEKATDFDKRFAKLRAELEELQRQFRELERVSQKSEPPKRQTEVDDSRIDPGLY
jgi:mono/diheme cytochrome c family protein